MNPIVCAIRGGDGSRRAQEEAIMLAAVRGAPLILVNVIDMALVSRMETPIADSVVQELEQIGKSLLSIAAERAAAHGVDAETIVLQGAVADALENFVRSSGATTLILGMPTSSASANAFDGEGFDRFVAHLRNSLAIEVVVV